MPLFCRDILAYAIWIAAKSHMEVSLSWCDKLASTPAAGIRMAPNFVPAEEILSSWRPILDKFTEEDRATFSMESIETFGASFNTEEGFKYSFDHSSLSVTFNHRVRAKPTSGGPPVMELLSRPAPYTEVLLETTDRLAEAINLMGNLKRGQIRRVGIVSLTSVELKDAPPGIVKLIEQIAAPLGGELDSMSGMIATKITTSASQLDRCLHSITIPEDNEKLATLQFDWQRLFLDHDPLTNSDIERVLKHAREDALAYFERVAEGGLNDG